MANVSITNLTAATAIGLDDVFPFTQLSDGTTKKATLRLIRPYVTLENFGGGTSKTAAQNVTALQSAQTELGSGGGNIIFSSTGVYEFNSSISLNRDINLIGQHTPGADATNAPAGTKIKRVADTVLFNLTGSNRTTGRVGRNLFRGIQFLDDTNISSNHFFSCKYADSLVFEHCTFWQPDGQTTAGHFIYAEECWDWRLWNVVFKHYGTSSGKDAIYVYNGTADNSNGWKFYATRWQEGQGRGVFFDSSGAGGSLNHDFEFFGCKWEDTGNGSLTHIGGVANNIHVSGGEIAGCGVRQISQAATSTRWRFTDAAFSNGGNTATEMIELLGNRSRIAGCTFQNPGSSVAQYINTTTADNEITGCNRASTTVPLINAASVNATTKIHHNPDFISEYASTAQITSGNTSVTVTHNLSGTVAQYYIMVCPHSDWASAAKFWVANVGATTFDIVVNANPGATITFVWWAVRVRG